MLSVRENLNGAGRVLRVAGKISRVRNKTLIFFLKQAFGRTYHFLPNTTMLRKRKRGRKPSRNLLLLRIKAAFYGEESQVQKNKGGLEKRVIQNNTYS